MPIIINMKTFKEFINEGISGYLQPKSEDDIIKSLENSGMRKSEIIRYIIKNNLSYSLLPRNEEGRCIHDGKLRLNALALTRLPDNLTVNGDLDVEYNNIEELPKGLIVNGTLLCQRNNLTKLPDDLKVGWSINCSHNEIVYLPNNIKNYNFNLNCRHNKITKLPDNLKIAGQLDCRYNQMEELPDNLTVMMDLYCEYNPLKRLPHGLSVVNGNLYVSERLYLPEDASIGGEYIVRKDVIKNKSS